MHALAYRGHLAQKQRAQEPLIQSMNPGWASVVARMGVQASWAPCLARLGRAGCPFTLQRHGPSACVAALQAASVHTGGAAAARTGSGAGARSVAAAGAVGPLERARRSPLPLPLPLPRSPGQRPARWGPGPQTQAPGRWASVLAGATATQEAPPAGVPCVGAPATCLGQGHRQMRQCRTGMRGRSGSLLIMLYRV